MITATAGAITAITGLVVALNGTGLFSSRSGSPAAPPAAVAPADVSGQWQASVAYGWGATHNERFAFQADGVMVFFEIDQQIDHFGFGCIHRLTLHIGCNLKTQKRPGSRSLADHRVVVPDCARIRKGAAHSSKLMRSWPQISLPL